MPHVREVRATPHEDHDPMLVAALAAGDLAGTDRDQAIALIQGCVECASLHDDLLAIARATATLPPPLPMPARDFRLSPQQAARLRPSGWRRLVPTGLAQAGFTRPLGVGLATFGLIGLLVTNVPFGLSLGSSGAASAPAEYTAGGGGAGAPVTADSNASSAPEIRAGGSPAGPVAYPAASAAASVAPGPAGSPNVPTSQGFGTDGAPSGSARPPEQHGSPEASGKVAIAGGSGPIASNAPPAPEATGRDLSAANGPSPTDLRNALFVVAIAVGLALLLLARRARRVA